MAANPNNTDWLQDPQVFGYINQHQQPSSTSLVPSQQGTPNPAPFNSPQMTTDTTNNAPSRLLRPRIPEAVLFRLRLVMIGIIALFFFLAWLLSIIGYFKGDYYQRLYYIRYCPPCSRPSMLKSTINLLTWVCPTIVFLLLSNTSLVADNLQLEMGVNSLMVAVPSLGCFIMQLVFIIRMSTLTNNDPDLDKDDKRIFQLHLITTAIYLYGIALFLAFINCWYVFKSENRRVAPSPTEAGPAAGPDPGTQAGIRSKIGIVGRALLMVSLSVAVMLYEFAYFGAGLDLGEENYYRDSMNHVALTLALLFPIQWSLVLVHLSDEFWPWCPEGVKLWLLGRVHQWVVDFISVVNLVMLLVLREFIEGAGKHLAAALLADTLAVYAFWAFGYRFIYYNFKVDSVSTEQQAGRDPESGGEAGNTPTQFGNEPQQIAE